MNARGYYGATQQPVQLHAPYVSGVPDDVLNQVYWWLGGALRATDAMQAWFAVSAAEKLLRPVLDSATKPEWSLYQTIYSQLVWLQDYLSRTPLPADWETQARNYKRKRTG